MPAKLEPTYIKEIKVMHSKGLTPEFIKYDTETVDGKFYQLPFGMVIIISLWTNGEAWTTVRRWTKEKEKYYRGLVGQEIKIEICQQ